MWLFKDDCVITDGEYEIVFVGAPTLIELIVEVAVAVWLFDSVSMPPSYSTLSTI